MARIRNKKASGLSLYLGFLARLGGLSEESIKMFVEFCHPRTLQKYEHILAAHSTEPLREKLEEELTFQNELERIVEDIKNLPQDSTEENSSLQLELKKVMSKAPKMLGTAWDNINISGAHRHERMTDKHGDLHYDYMTSMHFNERIDANHLDHFGKGFKTPEQLTLEDFVPNKDELELVFCSLVAMYSHDLLERHPLLFKSLKSSIKDHLPHQFQSQMNTKTEEFTGKIFQKSENKTEDLVSMIEDYQDKMVLKSEKVASKVFYRRQLTGDQKTEKNSHFAILSKSDENSAKNSLGLVIPGHEGFHFLMCLADVEAELFRNNTQGLEGGAFATATLLNRKKARLCKGK